VSEPKEERIAAGAWGGGCDRSGSCRGRGMGRGLVAAVWMVRRVCGG